MAQRPGWRHTGRRLLPFAVGIVALAGVVAAVAGPSDDGALRTTEGEGTEPGPPQESSTTRPAEPVIGDTPVTPSAATPGTTAAGAGRTTTTAAPATSTLATPTSTTPPTRLGARLQVKFADGSGVRLRDGRLVSLTGRDLTALNGVLARYPGTVIERLFSRSEEDLAAEKASIEASSGRVQPDLNLYYRLTLAAGADPAAAIADLSRLPVVERAYADPGPAPAPAPAP